MLVPRILFIMAILLAMALASPHAMAGPIVHKEEEAHDPSRSTALSRFLSSDHPRAKAMTCNKFPRVCHAKGSPGPDCCKKRCVNVKTDNHNCGECGRRCRFGWQCCGGKCVDVMYDRKNCGRCKNKCKKGSFCRYGMCSYA